MEPITLDSQLKKTVAPNKIRECLLNNDDMSDIMFLLGPEESPLRAHKMFLATASPIFLQLFESPTADDVIVKIASVTKPTMIEICRYAYTGNPPNLTQANVLDVLQAATKFEMRNLIEKCFDFVNQLIEKNVFRMLIENERCGNLRVNMKCFEFIGKNHHKCFTGGDFLRISNEQLRTIVMTCKMPRESVVKAINVWSKSNDASDFDDLISLTSPNQPTPIPAAAKAKQPPPPRARSQPRSQIAQNKQLTMSINPTVTQELTIFGSSTFKNFKYANLDMTVLQRAIFVREVCFISDLKLFDEEFTISLWKVEGTNRHKLYHDNVKMVGPCTSYKFRFPLEVPAEAKIWLNVDFPTSKMRLSYDDFYGMDTPELILRRDPSSKSYSEVISKVIYSTKN